MSEWISGLLLLGLGILWKSFAVAWDVHWYHWKYLPTTETTRNFCVNLCFQFRIWNCFFFFSWKDPQVLFSLRYLKHIISYTGSNETWIFILLLWWIFVVYFLCTFFPSVWPQGMQGIKLNFHGRIVLPCSFGWGSNSQISWQTRLSQSLALQSGWSFRGDNTPDQAFWCFWHSGNVCGGTQWDLLVCSYQNAAVI